MIGQSCIAGLYRLASMVRTCSLRSAPSIGLNRSCPRLTYLLDANQASIIKIEILASIQLGT